MNKDTSTTAKRGGDWMKELFDGILVGLKAFAACCLSAFFLKITHDECWTALKIFITCWLAAFALDVIIHMYRQHQCQSRTKRRQSKRRNSDKNPPELLDASSNEDAILFDLVCPITLELPFEAVTAEDGRVYEKSAIEKYFKSQGSREIRSCYTNEVMGKKLLPAPHVTTKIQRLIDNGEITGIEAQTWKRKVVKRANKDKMLEKALNGDVKSMEIAAFRYAVGLHGFEKDKEIAGYWAKQASNAGSVFGMGMTGCLLANGEGCRKNEKEGLMYLAMAAGEGSDWAACKLGTALALGKYGLETNQAEAIRLLRKSLSDSCPHKTLTKEAKHKAHQLLKKLEL